MSAPGHRSLRFVVGSALLALGGCASEEPKKEQPRVYTNPGSIPTPEQKAAILRERAEAERKSSQSEAASKSGKAPPLETKAASPN